MSKKQWRNGYNTGMTDQYFQMKEEDSVWKQIIEISQLRWDSRKLLLIAAEKINQLDTGFPRPCTAPDIRVLVRSAEKLFDISDRLAKKHGDSIETYWAKKNKMP